MSELGDRMALIASTLAAKYPARKVTRELLDFSDRPAADLAAGIYTLLSKGESGYENLPGRAGMDGRQGILLVGQFELGEDNTGVDIEDAEFVMVDEIKTFVQTLPPTLCRIDMKSFQQSQQLERPNGWISVSLEYVP